MLRGFQISQNLQEIERRTAQAIPLIQQRPLGFPPLASAPRQLWYDDSSLPATSLDLRGGHAQYRCQRREIDDLRRLVDLAARSRPPWRG